MKGFLVGATITVICTMILVSMSVRTEMANKKLRSEIAVATMETEGLKAREAHLREVIGQLRRGEID